MAQFSVFPSDDREQSIRFRRYLIASGTSLIVVFLLGVCVLAGVLAWRPFGIAASGVLVSIVTFYLLFRSGLNRRAADPSLTLPMMLAAICVSPTPCITSARCVRVFLLIYPMIMLFGVFRLDTRAQLLVGALILSAYALVVRLLGERAGRLDPKEIELVRGLVLATVLTWFSFMGVTYTISAGGCAKAATIA